MRAARRRVHSAHSMLAGSTYVHNVVMRRMIAAIHLARASLRPCARRGGTRSDHKKPPRRQERRGGLSSGRGGIRTHGTLSRTHTFQACALNHSATRPTNDCGPAKPNALAAQPPNQRAEVHVDQRADRVRFELTVPLPVRRFSRPVLSTTQPPVLSSLRI